MKINLQTSPEGYLGISKMFTQDILGRMYLADQEDSRVILENIVSISVYLAVNHQQLYDRFNKWFKGGVA